MAALEFQYDDGGRESAGFKGKTGDCVTRAIAIVTGKPYLEIYNTLNKLSQGFNQRHSKPRRTKRGIKIYRKCDSSTGVYRKVYEQYLLSLGMKWIPCMKIGSGCKVHLRKDELPSGRLIVQVSGRLTAVIDGVIHDIFNPSREASYIQFKDGIETRGTAGRCVYGYYTF